MPETAIRVFQDKSGNRPLETWLAELEEREPTAFVRCLAVILELARLGNQLRRPACDYLRDGIFELRAKVGRVHYRVVYFFCSGVRNTACLSHGCKKEGAVPPEEIERAIKHRQLVNSNMRLYTAEWEDDDEEN